MRRLHRFSRNHLPHFDKIISNVLNCEMHLNARSNYSENYRQRTIGLNPCSSRRLHIKACYHQLKLNYLHLPLWTRAAPLYAMRPNNVITWAERTRIDQLYGATAVAAAAAAAKLWSGTLRHTGRRRWSYWLIEPSVRPLPSAPVAPLWAELHGLRDRKYCSSLRRAFLWRLRYVTSKVPMLTGRQAQEVGLGCAVASLAARDHLTAARLNSAVCCSGHSLYTIWPTTCVSQLYIAHSKHSIVLLYLSLWLIWSMYSLICYHWRCAQTGLAALAFREKCSRNWPSVGSGVRDSVNDQAAVDFSVTGNGTFDEFSSGRINCASH